MINVRTLCTARPDDNLSLLVAFKTNYTRAGNSEFLSEAIFFRQHEYSFVTTGLFNITTQGSVIVVLQPLFCYDLENIFTDLSDYTVNACSVLLGASYHLVSTFLE